MIALPYSLAMMVARKRTAAGWLAARPLCHLDSLSVGWHMAFRVLGTLESCLCAPCSTAVRRRDVLRIKNVLTWKHMLGD